MTEDWVWILRDKGLEDSGIESIKSAMAGEGRLFCLDGFEVEKLDAGMRLSYLFNVWLANWTGANSVKADREMTLEEVRNAIREQRQKLRQDQGGE